MGNLCVHVSLNGVKAHLLHHVKAIRFDISSVISGGLECEVKICSN